MCVPSILAASQPQRFTPTRSDARPQESQRRLLRRSLQQHRGEDFRFIAAIYTLHAEIVTFPRAPPSYILFFYIVAIAIIVVVGVVVVCG